jgi:glutaredoxin 3
MPTQNDVTVFTTQTCPYCTMAKNYLRSKGIAFKEVDVSTDEQQAMQMIMKSGQMGVPQLWINNEVVVGFDLPRINALLNL